MCSLPLFRTHGFPEHVLSQRNGTSQRITLTSVKAVQLSAFLGVTLQAPASIEVPKCCSIREFLVGNVFREGSVKTHSFDLDVPAGV